MNEERNVTCFRWHFRGDLMKRYFYSDTLKECVERIKKTYRCSENDFTVDAIEYRDEISNNLVKEVSLDGTKDISLIW